MMIRTIKKEDNKSIAKVIRDALVEFNANKEGTVFTDPTTDDLYSLFQTKNAIYYVAELKGEIVGGCGLFPTKGLDNNCIELVKLYIKKSARGSGLGKELMERCISKAREFGFTRMYLESMPELKNAIGLYEQMGFIKLEASLGESGHHACDIWMELKLN